MSREAEGRRDGEFEDALKARRGRRVFSKVEAVPTPEPASLATASVGRRWKFRRNLVICIAHRHGASQRLLADVFDLPHSRIAAIVKEFREKYETG